MKNLLLIRHAKTEQSGFTNDIKRRLTERGFSDCELMATRLNLIKFDADLILTSPAERAIQTCQHLAKLVHWPASKIQIISDLYLASSQKLIKIIEQNKVSINTLTIIAHNPGLTDLFNVLGNVKLGHLPTCGMALFQFNTESWDTIEIGEGQLIWYSWPKKNDES